MAEISQSEHDQNIADRLEEYHRKVDEEVKAGKAYSASDEQFKALKETGKFTYGGMEHEKTEGQELSVYLGPDNDPIEARVSKIEKSPAGLWDITIEKVN